MSHGFDYSDIKFENGLSAARLPGIGLSVDRSAVNLFFLAEAAILCNWLSEKLPSEKKSVLATDTINSLFGHYNQFETQMVSSLEGLQARTLPFQDIYYRLPIGRTCKDTEALDKVKIVQSQIETSVKANIDLIYHTQVSDNEDRSNIERNEKILIENITAAAAMSLVDCGMEAYLDSKMKMKSSEQMAFTNSVMEKLLYQANLLGINNLKALYQPLLDYLEILGNVNVESSVLESVEKLLQAADKNGRRLYDSATQEAIEGLISSIRLSMPPVRIPEKLRLQLSELIEQYASERGLTI